MLSPLVLLLQCFGDVALTDLLVGLAPLLSCLQSRRRWLDARSKQQPAPVASTSRLRWSIRLKPPPPPDASAPPPPAASTFLAAGE
ncbi:Os01g0380000 [Oryza sativa Japonica Group]|uniref:Os01g0380000 protein n=1 Tax=Oryza sativa subsp. japonica TaxID=39947 RepID=A0A0P0V2U5_ORYSJ|nr:Os01g0380000 [Oryza sativa Japonica Group]